MIIEPKAMRQAIEARIVEVKQELLANAYDLARDRLDTHLMMHIRLWSELGALEQVIKVQPPDYTGWIKAMG